MKDDDKHHRMSTRIQGVARAAIVVASLALIGSTACALTSKAEALTVRYYDPESVAPVRLTSAGAPTAPQIEIGRVSSGVNLREKIAYRTTAFEVGFYDDRRWTERPEVYVRRALARTLFEEHGFTRALAGQAPTLDVEVVAFEELRGGARSAGDVARVRLRVVLHDDRDALLEKTITVDRPVARGGEHFEAFARAMAEAMDAATHAIAQDILGRLVVKEAAPR
jgi:cholesterol transport system auxiliary component